jgi:hypothetical protein
MKEQLKLLAFINRDKNICATYFCKENANFIVLKKLLKVNIFAYNNNKFYWRKRAEEMFLFNSEYFYCGEKCNRKKAVIEFQKISGFKLNELLKGEKVKMSNYKKLVIEDLENEIEDLEAEIDKLKKQLKK